MEIYRIVERNTDKEVGVYMPPSARDKYNFSSIWEARHSNCHGIYEDKVNYKIRKYKLVLIDDDCDPPTEEDYEKAEQKKMQKEEERQLKEKISIEKYGKQLDELSMVESLNVTYRMYAQKIEDICNKYEESISKAISSYEDLNIKNCSTCKNNVEFPPPHTCDICTSLDQDEEYSMWEEKE